MLNVSTKKEPGKITLSLSGRFNFESHQAFKAAYTPILNESSFDTLIIDFAGVNYMDSSALGMLLMIRERLATTAKTIVLANSQGPVKEVLQVANFGRIFKIE